MKSASENVSSHSSGVEKRPEVSRHAAFKSAVRRVSASGRFSYVVDARAQFGILPVGTVAKNIAWPKL